MLDFFPPSFFPLLELVASFNDVLAGFFFLLGLLFCLLPLYCLFFLFLVKGSYQLSFSFLLLTENDDDSTPSPPSRPDVGLAPG